MQVSNLKQQMKGWGSSEVETHNSYQYHVSVETTKLYYLKSCRQTGLPTRRLNVSNDVFH